MNKNATILFTFISLFFVSCGPSTEEKRADYFLTKAQLYIDENKFDVAQQQLDSVHLLFPKLIDKRKTASALEDTLARRQSNRSLEYCEKMLPVKIQEQDSLLKMFRYEKNEKYQTYGNFISRYQVTEQNYHRNFLKCYVDENADLYLISQYAGATLNHRMVKLSFDNSFVISDTTQVEAGEFYSFNDDGMYFESMTFVNDRAKDMVAFISNNASSRIKVELKGKRTYSYFLSDNDKKAIAITYKLWQTMKQVKLMTIEVNKANRKLFYINQRNVKSAQKQN